MCWLHNLKQFLIAFDQMLNALVGLFTPWERSWADETFSSRCWRWHVAGVRSWPYRLVECLFFWERGGHCEDSFMSERLGRQLPPEARPAGE